MRYCPTCGRPKEDHVLSTESGTLKHGGVAAERHRLCRVNFEEAVEAEGRRTPAFVIDVKEYDLARLRREKRLERAALQPHRKVPTEAVEKTPMPRPNHDQKRKARKVQKRYRTGAERASRRAWCGIHTLEAQVSLAMQGANRRQTPPRKGSGRRSKKYWRQVESGMREKPPEPVGVPLDQVMGAMR